ncbi:MAG TPA: hypothetical protein VI248_26935 [Kineosporiaceae bacterium]
MTRLASPTAVGRAVVLVLATGLTGGLVGAGVQRAAAGRSPAWVLGRATGVTGLLLLTALVLVGLVLAHPWRGYRRLLPTTSLISVHVGLAAGCLVLLGGHVAALATDGYAQVGWWGALLPMGSGYRPVPVTLGVLAGYAGLAAGVTAGLAGRLGGRWWWPVHRVALTSFVLTWTHGLLTGSDSGRLLPVYLGCGSAVLVVAVSRYVSATPADRVRDLIIQPRPDPRAQPQEAHR